MAPCFRGIAPSRWSFCVLSVLQLIVLVGSGGVALVLCYWLRWIMKLPMGPEFLAHHADHDYYLLRLGSSEKLFLVSSLQLPAFPP